MITRHHRHDERGAIIIHVAVALLGLLAFSSFTIDNGIRMVARGQAQTAADAGAMAAALYLAWDDPADFAGARAAAIVAAQQNVVWGEAPDVQLGDVTFPTCPPGAPGLVDTCVQMNVFRNQARTNAIPTVFARLAGAMDQGVQATAIAQVLYGTGPGPGDCVKPFAIPDRWGEYRNDEAVTTPWVDDIPQMWPIDEAYSLEAAEHPWDPNDEYNVRYLNGPNHGEYLNDPVVDPATAGDPIDRYPRLFPAPSDGYHIPADPQLEIPENDNGVRLTLKHGNGTQISSSWYYPIVLPNTCGTGAACYRANIEGCATGVGLSVGSGLMNEPGNMVGPTGQGIDALYLQDSGASWTSDGPGGTYPRGIISGGMGMASPRLVIVPTFNPKTFMAGHMNGRIGGGGKGGGGGPSNPEIVITSFVGIFFLPMAGNDVPGHLSPLNFTPTPDNLSDDPTSFLRTVILVR